MEHYQLIDALTSHDPRGWQAVALMEHADLTAIEWAKIAVAAHRAKSPVPDVPGDGHRDAPSPTAPRARRDHVPAAVHHRLPAPGHVVHHPTERIPAPPATPAARTPRRHHGTALPGADHAGRALGQSPLAASRAAARRDTGGGLMDPVIRHHITDDNTHTV